MTDHVTIHVGGGSEHMWFCGGGAFGVKTMSNNHLSWFIHSAKHFNMALQSMEESIENKMLHPPSEVFLGETIDKPYDDPPFGFSIVLTYLSAVIVELSIKIIWLLEKNKKDLPDKKQNHKILELFKELSDETQSKIRETYDRITDEVIKKYKIYNKKRIILEKALKRNEKIMRNYKYKNVSS